jgi:hypothetical protein
MTEVDKNKRLVRTCEKAPAKHIITDADHTDADHIITDADHVSTGADHHRVTRSPPLPRPRPAELASPPVASKEKTPTPIQIND